MKTRWVPPKGLTSTAEQFLQRFAERLDIPDSRYEAAERSYRSVGEWLNRPDSTLASFSPEVYSQGSFRLGTAIRPPNDEEHYDLDIVCGVRQTKTQITQEQLKAQVGKELKAYARAHNMDPPTEEQYCWTMNYADGVQFKMDVLPAIPDFTRQKLLLEAAELHTGWVASAVAITNTEHPRYQVITDDWPVSNPRGYSEWFRSRMRVAFDARRQVMALNELKKSVEEIPEYRVKTPLQAAVQILKRHRDMTFLDRLEQRPTSIVITTLAAHAYEQEETISAALLSILGKMNLYIEDRNNTVWIANPTDPRENFADRWSQEADLRTSFDEWLQSARADFDVAVKLNDEQTIADELAPRLGRSLVESARASKPSSNLRSRAAATVRRILDAPHRQPLQWPTVQTGSVTVSATATQKGFRPRAFSSDSSALEKNCSLQFEADTNVLKPYDVYWQVVNTGIEAKAARNLRGSFEQAYTERGHLKKTENTLYQGTHSIECFIVRNGYCLARSGPFIVNIE